MGLRGRRWRCPTHEAYLLNSDERCPRCLIKKLEKELETVRAREAMFKGKNVILALNSSFDSLLQPILKILGFDRTNRYDNDDLEEVRIGGLGDHTSYYVVPKNTATAMVEIAEKVEKYLVDSMYNAARDVRCSVESSLAEAVRETIDEVVAEGAVSRSAAKTIVHDILYNSSKSLSWEDERGVVSKKAIKAVKKIINKYAIVKKGKD